jgi:aminobenzoyl-glutamate utilization protein B
MDHYAEVAHQIWEFAEVGYQETQSTELLQAQLQAAGFSVENGVAGIPTAFVASYGSGQPVIGILAEFDALPGVSQAAVPMRQEREEVNAGHACGHHLFGTASSAAAIAIKDWLVTSGTSGTIRVYGTPAEEGGAGKVYMVREGLMDDVDAILHWHPGNENSADASSSLANKSGKFRFYGKASHASSAPDQGRSALDGVEAMNMMVNMMREHIPMESRIHYVITRGGEAPNVVPAYAEVYYYVRHPEAAVSGALFDRVVKAAEGAAIGTGTKMEYEVIHGIYNLLPNVTLAEKMYENLKKVGGFTYTEEEKSFAEKIHTTLGDPKAVTVANEIKPFEVRLRGTGGSTDVGDVSWVAPTAGLRTATWVPGTPAHSWQAVAAGGTSIGHKGMMVAAKTLTLTAIDIFKDPSLAEKAKKELNERRGKNFEYKPLLGDREPPLDYRN